MNIRKRIAGLLCGALATTVLAAQTPQPPPAGQRGQAPRDLVLEKPATPERLAGAIPRGYALVVGVAHYQNLDAAKQLQFPETDADAMYRVLISHEGGAFPAENVHFLKGGQATLANIKRELEEWLPSVAQPADRVVVFFRRPRVREGRTRVSRAVGRASRSPGHDGLSDDHRRRRAGQQGEGDVEGAAHRRLPFRQDQRRDDQRGARRAVRRLPASFLTLTATTEREQSFEDPKLSTGFGFFTYFLVQALRGYADNDPCDGQDHRRRADRVRPHRTCAATRASDGCRRRRRRAATTSRRCCWASRAGVWRQTTRRRRCSARRSSRPTWTTSICTSTATLIGRISKAKPLVVPSLSSGLHEFQGVKSGLRARPQGGDDRARPGSRPSRCASATSRQIKKPALDLNDAGREAALHAALVAEPDEPRAGRAQAERRRPEARRGLFETARRRGSVYTHGGLSPRPGEPAAPERSRRALPPSSGRSPSTRRTSSRASSAPRC